MSEIDDLVKRLRRLDYKTDLDEDAANALEMQAKWLEGFVKHSDEMAIALSSKATQADHLFVENDKLRARIAELERREKHLEEMFHGWRDEAQKGCARIAELEAALNGWQKWWELPWQDRRPDIAERCYRAASAALNGEKV